jgi:hypothetical protein
MKKIILMSVVFFAFCSCASDDAGFDQISKKEIMESWAWKIFIFTDEGEIMPDGAAKNNLDNTIKNKSILVEDIWKIYKNENLFLNNQKVNADFTENKTKK